MAAETKNIDAQIEGNTLILKIDLTKNYGLSSTGKSLTVASSGGFQAVPGSPMPGLKMNVNVTLPPNK
jgi:hypothetical protein